jgi:hypothetical protein
MSPLRRLFWTGLFQPFPSTKRSPRSSLSILSQVKIPEFSQGSPHNTESFASFYKNESERKKVKNPSIRAQICNKSIQQSHTRHYLFYLNSLKYGTCVELDGFDLLQ